jgi:hypothetical protein
MTPPTSNSDECVNFDKYVIVTSNKNDNMYFITIMGNRKFNILHKTGANEKLIVEV